MTSTTTTTYLPTWASHPVGKVARGAIAVGGSITATLVLMTASVVQSGTWALVLLGVGLAASSVWAAKKPSAAGLLLVAATMVAIPFALQIS
jgi:hypothetical protein